MLVLGQSSGSALGSSPEADNRENELCAWVQDDLVLSEQGCQRRGVERTS